MNVIYVVVKYMTSAGNFFFFPCKVDRSVGKSSVELCLFDTTKT